MENNENGNESGMDKAFGCMYWVRIALSPVLLAVIIAFVVFVSMHSVAGALIAALIFLAGCFIGYRMSENARKTCGTVEFAARTMHNVEFDAEAGKDKK